ncbi:DUF2155 domain-containing protein [Phenylobacterium deserti]|uniref:DUF2155 domain-containing protein n=1 Tax=Phenylobacterium deserti TaxID=1914756 RepID=A0A328A941_9CAUL|nr:DUF2155 domain-containing protein [Phenylobacterium deserti]
MIRRAAWLAPIAGAAAAGLVWAQAAPKAAPPRATPAPEAPPANTTAAPATIPPDAEEAPPVSVPTPEPIAVPPITEKEVAPAPPPKAAEVKPAPEAPRRPRYDVAVLQALDKVTAQTLRFEAAVGKPVRYKTLVFTVRACERSASDEGMQDSIAYLTVDSQPRPAPGKPAPPARQVFKGWMYASSPSLHPLEHPVYDAWVINCRASAPVTAAAAPAAPVSR